MPAVKSVYKSYLVRIWSDEHRPARVLVVRIDKAGEQLYFANLDELMMFLLEETETGGKANRSM